MTLRNLRVATTLALLASTLPRAAAAQQGDPPPPAAPSTPAPEATPEATQAPASQGDLTTAPPALPPPPPTEPPAAAPPPPPSAVTQGPRAAIIDAAPLGVDPAAARFVTETLRARVAELGFQVIPTQELYAAASQLRLPFPVPAEGIYELERVLQAPVAVHAEVRAGGGQYLVRLRVRIAVEAGERVRMVAATQFQLAEAIREAMPALLAPPQPGATPAVIAPPPVAVMTADQGLGFEPRPRRRRSVRAHPRRFELSLGAIAAIGPGQDPFVNALIVGRFRWFPLDRFGVSASLGYANLRGRDERVSNVLPMIGVETSVDLVPSAHVFIPLRFEAGFLPNNGPVFRLTAGIAFNLARRVRLEIDILSPTVWVLPETAPVTLDLGAHVAFLL